MHKTNTGRSLDRCANLAQMLSCHNRTLLMPFVSSLAIVLGVCASVPAAQPDETSYCKAVASAELFDATTGWGKGCHNHWQEALALAEKLNKPPRTLAALHIRMAETAAAPFSQTEICPADTEKEYVRAIKIYENTPDCTGLLIIALERLINRLNKRHFLSCNQCDLFADPVNRDWDSMTAEDQVRQERLADLKTAFNEFDKSSDLFGALKVILLFDTCRSRDVESRQMASAYVRVCRKSVQFAAQLAGSKKHWTFLPPYGRCLELQSGRGGRDWTSLPQATQFLKIYNVSDSDRQRAALPESSLKPLKYLEKAASATFTPELSIDCFKQLDTEIQRMRLNPRSFADRMKLAESAAERRDLRAAILEATVAQSIKDDRNARQKINQWRCQLHANIYTPYESEDAPRVRPWLEKLIKFKGIVSGHENGDALALESLTCSYLAASDYQNAYATWKKHSTQGDPEEATRLAHLALLSGNLSDSIAILQEVVSSRYDNYFRALARAHMQLSMLYSCCGKYDQAGKQAALAKEYQSKLKPAPPDACTDSTPAERHHVRVISLDL
jgi:hypothetical protein